MVNDEIRYLRRYQDACSTLAEMAMVEAHRVSRRRYVLFYDDEEAEYFVHRLWYDADGRLQEEEVARAAQVHEAVDAAYRRFTQETTA